MYFLIIAGGIFLSQPTQELNTHTLRGEKIPDREVTCWSEFGTPMLPDGKGGYSMIAPINKEYIEASLQQPPKPEPYFVPAFLPYRPADEPEVSPFADAPGAAPKP